MWPILNFFKRFTLDLVLAIKYRAFEYDDQLKLTKTNSQRFLIWFVILTISCIAIYFALSIFGKAILNVTKYHEKIIPQ